MKRIVQFVMLTFLISWTLWLLQYLGQEEILPSWFQIFGMFGLFGPFIVFMILVKKDGLTYKEVFKKLFQKASIKIILFAVLSPMIISAISYIIYRNYAVGDIEPIGVTFASFVPLALSILFVGGPVEEFGWRGYLLPRLRGKYSFILTIIIMGIIHGVWHIPLHFLDGTVQQALPIYEYLIVTLAITVSYVFIYEYTKSLIPMIILHWMANLSSAIFPYFYNIEGRYALLILTLVLDIILIGIYYIKKRKNEKIIA
ncbi:CPBP family intramembrane glutamic endopeptidase [Candidatus Izemoplasma sp. B36]|uniref:CPBP family intramembrane glutamic endopeptidase n=1 Tax=Candidatus Izemoplasma sp. B36 TaxID=3242468 RepID=UPI003557F288